MTEMSADVKILWSVIVVLVAGFFSLLIWNMAISHTALNKAEIAIRKAEQARPNPYTSVMSAKDWRLHTELHNEFRTTIIEYFSAQMELTKANLQTAIATLPRPPLEVANEIKSLSRRVTALEYKLGYSNLMLDTKRKQK